MLILVFVCIYLTWVFVILFDLNSPGPDITREDGIYSRILPHLNAGKYSVSVRIEGKVRQVYFTRLLRLGVINVRIDPHPVDAIPPSRIVDLRASVLPGLPSKVSFTWTAPGNDYDRGRANKYLVRMSLTPDLQKGLLFGDDWTAPLEAFTVQHHTVTWPYLDTVTYVSILAMDHFGNKSPLSNVVSIFIASPPTTTTHSYSFFPGISGDDGHFEQISTANGEAFNLQLILIISGCVVALIVVVGFSYCLCLIKGGQIKEKSPVASSSYRGGVIANGHGTFSTKRTNSNESIKKEFLSPHESWTPSQLLNGHKDATMGSVSAGSDGMSDYSDSIKKSYNACSNNVYYGSNPTNDYQYQTAGYTEVHPESYPENYPANTGYQAQAYGYPINNDYNEYVSAPQCDNYPSVDGELSPGPPGYPGYPDSYPDNGTLRRGKMPPSIPPKPSAVHSHEPHQFELQDHSNPPSIASSEKRLRNVTMV